MKARDREYVENRLLAPAPDLLDAIERLRETGHGAEAQRLADALADLTDVCRAVRNELGLGILRGAW